VPLPVLLAALGVAGLGAGCFLAADSLPLLLIGRLLFGLSAGVFTGTATATADAAIGIWAMPEPVGARTRPDLHVQLVRIPRDMRTLFIDAAIAAFAGYAVIGLFTAVAPALLGQDLGVTSPAAVGAIVFAG
jgi:hypothetical protein